MPLGLAALYGFLTAATFALWPLARAMRIPGAALFRDPLLPARVRLRGRLLAVNVLLAAALVALTVATADDPRFAGWFCAAAIGTLALFRAGGWAVMRLAAALPHGGVSWLRLGLSNLHRPGNTTPLMLVSLGLGLSTLAAVALIQGNLRRQVADQIPEHAPSFFFIDIQNTQMDRFRQIMAAPARGGRFAGSAEHARPGGRGERCAGGPGEGHARHHLGAARRSWPDLCRRHAQRHQAGGGALVAG